MALTSKTKAAIGAVAAAAVVAGGVVAFAGDDETAKAGGEERLTLRVGVQKDGIRAILEKTGEIEDAPYDVEFSTFQFGPPLVEAAGADKIDLAWVGSTPPIFGAAAGTNFKVIAAVQEDDHQENSILVPKDSTITKVEQLAGKKVAVPKGSSANGLLFRALNRVGVPVKNVQIKYLPPADGLAAFQQGSVDALVVWDPFVQQATQQQGAKVITGGRPDEEGLGFEIASAKALEDPAKREAITDYLQRLQRAWTWARENPDGWAEAWSKDSGLPIEVTKEAAPKKASKIIAVDDFVLKTQQTLADLLAKEKALPKPIEFESIVDTSVFTPEG